MQDFEVPRWEAAKAAFDEAFALGYSRAKAELAAQPQNQTGDAKDRWNIDVPRRDIVDGVALGYVPLFQQAGRDAALARRREDNVAACMLERDPDHWETLSTGQCRWVVMLDPPYIATPQ